MEEFKKQYRDLETKVMHSLSDAIEKSTLQSKHINTKAIKVNIFEYTELVIVNDRLTFLDADGQHYSVFAQASLKDLIDIFNGI